jgi:multiple sugar transport system substrate-binding protein
VAALQELVRTFETQTLIRVSIAHLPARSYHDQIVLQHQRRFTQFDLSMVMSHWRAAHTRLNYYVDLSEFLKRDGGFMDVHPVLRGLLSEYPPQSGLYMAAPFYPNPMVWLYRADWFGDPDEREGFKNQFGQELVAPSTWVEAMQIAEYFTRPESGRYGMALPMSREFDGLVFTWTQLLWAGRGRLGDPDTYRVDGYLNGAQARLALEDLRAALAWSPPFSSAASPEDVLQHYAQGRVAMAPVPYSALQGLRSAFGARIGVTTWPGGPAGSFSHIPGYSLAISTKIPPENQERSRQFLRWFMRPDIQERWLELTGMALARGPFESNRAELLGSDFQTFTRAIKEGQSFWDVPVYTTLMRLMQDHIGDAVDGYVTVDRALDQLSEQASALLREAGLLMEF